MKKDGSKNKKGEIISLIREAATAEKPRDAGRRLNPKYILVLLSIFVVATALSLYGYFDMKKDLNDFRSDIKKKVADTLNRAKQLEEEKKYLAARELYLSAQGLAGGTDDSVKDKIAELDEKILLRKEMQAYIDKLQIKNIHLLKNSNELRVTGDIINAGKRPLNDIELTIYCIDADERPVCETKHLTVSSDGKPLKRYQRRKFVVIIPNVPESAKEVQVVVSDIEFGDGGFAVTEY